MTTDLDYYHILQVHPEAEAEVIHAAYRKLAAKYHPDVNGAPGAAEKMKQINRAYEMLSDPRRRAEYDMSRTLSSKHGPVKTTAKTLSSWPSWKTLLFVALILLLVFVVPRFGPAILFSLARFAIPLLVAGLVIWFIYSFTSPR